MRIPLILLQSLTGPPPCTGARAAAQHSTPAWPLASQPPSPNCYLPALLIRLCGFMSQLCIAQAIYSRDDVSLFCWQ